MHPTSQAKPPRPRRLVYALLPAILFVSVLAAYLAGPAQASVAADTGGPNRQTYLPGIFSSWLQIIPTPVPTLTPVPSPTPAPTPSPFFADLPALFLSSLPTPAADAP